MSLPEKEKSYEDTGEDILRRNGIKTVILSEIVSRLVNSLLPGSRNGRNEIPNLSSVHCISGASLWGDID